MNDLSTFIRDSFGIPLESVDQVTGLFIRSTLNPLDYYLRTNQYCTQLSFIESGYIRIYGTHSGKEVTQWIGGPGHLLTDLQAFIYYTRSRWNMVALNHCCIYSIPQDRYADLKTVVPNWDQIERRFLAKCFATLENRVFGHLSMTAQERYELCFNANPKMFNEVPLKYIASMLGMSAETLSRLRSQNSS